MTLASPTLTRPELLAEIQRRRPWYQRIEFPDHGVSTTDDRANALLDAAWDNKLGDLTLEQAAIQRPRPKWNAFRSALPRMAGLDVLEIGSNCGFFSFEFARAGARRVVGLDVSPKWLDNARWAAGVLGYDNVNFVLADFMTYIDGAATSSGGLLGDGDAAIPLPNGQFDVVFTSTVIDHLFFPMFAIYKMLRIARRHVIIDTPVLPTPAAGVRPAMTLSIAEDRTHHGFQADPEFWRTYVLRLGVAEGAVRQHLYNEGRNMCMVIDCEGRSSALWGA